MAISIVVPAAPDWEPFDINDVLDQDGYFSAVLSRISERAKEGKTPGVFLSFTLRDEDYAGAVIGKFVGSKDKDVTFIYRNMIYSATGDKAAAKAGFEINEGWVGRLEVWLKTQAYADDTGEQRTGVEKFVLREEYEQAKAAGGARFRWPAKIRAGSSLALPGGAGGLTPMAGLPGGIGAVPLPAPAFAPPNGGGAPSPVALVPPPAPGGFAPPAPPPMPAAPPQPNIQAAAATAAAGFRPTAPATPPTPPTAAPPNPLGALFGRRQ